MGSFGVYLPDESALASEIKRRADLYHDGKVSAFVRSCIEKEVKRNAEIPDPVADMEILTTLARRILDPLEAETFIALAPQGVDQRIVLQGLLRSHLSKLKADASVHGRRKLLVSDATHMLNEEQSPYGDDGVGQVETDHARRVVSCNAAFTGICGYTIDEIKGKNLRDVLHGPQTEEAAKQLIKQGLVERREVAATITNYRKDKSVYVANVVLRPTAGGYAAEVRLAPSVNPAIAAVDAEIDRRLKQQAAPSRPVAPAAKGKG